MNHIVDANKKVDMNERVWCDNCRCDRLYTLNGAGMYICHACRMDITPDEPAERDAQHAALSAWMEEVTHATLGQPNWREVRRALEAYKTAGKKDE